MTKALKISLVILTAGLLAIQFFPVEKNVSATVPATDFLKVNNVPERLAYQLQTSCYDCHSNNTNYPWYSNLQPAAWFLVQHIKDGKEELNFNNWGTLSERRKRSKLSSIISQIEDDEMPLSSYLLVHWNARLDSSVSAEIILYMEKLKDQ